MRHPLSVAGVGFLIAMIIPVAAGAADMAVKAPPPPPLPPPFSWTGFYIGGEIGGVWSNGHISDTLDGFDVSTSHDGIIGGGDVGFNYQTGNFVFGVEGNFDWTSLKATGSGVVIPAVGTLQASANTDWITTVAGRFGLAYNQLLFYGKAGGGWVGNTATVTNLTTGASISASNTRTGWLGGGGIEWAFDPHWSAKVEYDYIGLHSWTFTGPLIPGDTWTANRNIQKLTVGLNYRFGLGNGGY
jgi:outer membrane immunogenic protein